MHGAGWEGGRDVDVPPGQPGGGGGGVPAASTNPTPTPPAQRLPARRNTRSCTPTPAVTARPPPLPAVWYVSRPVVLAAACLLILAPLLSLRDLGRLGPMSTAGGASIAATCTIPSPAMCTASTPRLPRHPTPQGWSSPAALLLQWWASLVSPSPSARLEGGGLLRFSGLPWVGWVVGWVGGREAARTTGGRAVLTGKRLSPALLPPLLSSPPSDFHWLPTPDMVGDTLQHQAVTLLSVLPVISLSFICQ